MYKPAADEEEVWKDIVGFEGKYQISSFGRVKRLEGFNNRVDSRYGKNVKQPVKEAILKATPNVKSGYPMLALCKNGRCFPRYIHNLVAEAFIGPKPKTIDGKTVQVCHNDGIPSNVYYRNLRYDTPIGNSLDRHLHETDSIGERNPMNKYSEDFVANIKRDLLTTKQCIVADNYSIPRSTVRSIKQGKIWSHVLPELDIEAAQNRLLSTEVYMVDYVTGTIHIFSTREEASEFSKLTIESIASRCSRNKGKFAKTSIAGYDFLNMRDIDIYDPPSLTKISIDEAVSSRNRFFTTTI